MALYDMYERYRDTNYTAEEERLLAIAREEDAEIKADTELQHVKGGVINKKDGLFVPYPLVQAHIGIALDRAEAQFKGHPAMPEDGDVAIRFPGVDPRGKYSVIDMKFAQRISAIEAALESRSPEAQAYARELLGKCTDRRGGGAFYNEYITMKMCAQKHRALTRGSKLCIDEDGRRLMHQQARGLETELAVVQFDKLLQGIEYAAGVRTGPVPQEVAEHYSQVLQTDLNMELVGAAQKYYQPAKIEMHFQDFDNKMLQKAFADPRNWGMPPAELAEFADSLVDIDTYASAIPPYAVATAGRVIEPAFREAERVTGGRLDRGDLIIIDGKTVKEKMLEDYTRSQRDPDKFNEFYQKNLRQAASEYTAAALLAGKRVEAFMPDGKGRLPDQPTQIVRTGYEPSALKPEKFNLWQRHFAKRGYYKEKVARQEEYERMMAARERVKENAAKERAGRLKEAVATHDRYASINNKGLFFDQLIRDRISAAPAKEQEAEKLEAEAAKSKDPAAVEKAAAARKAADRYKRYQKVMTTDADGRVKYDWQALDSVTPDGPFKHFGRTEAADVCIGYLAAQGHSFRDIMDPNKLQAERAAVGKLYMERAEAGDGEWLGRAYYEGHKAILEQARTMTQGLDLQDDRTLIRVMPELEAMVHTAFGTSQMLKEDACQRGYCKQALSDMGLDPAMATKEQMLAAAQRAFALNDKVNDVTSCCDALLRGLETQAALTTPGMELPRGGISNLGMMRLTLDHMKPGASILEQAPSIEENILFLGAVLTNPKLEAAVNGITATPKGAERIALDAASGKLMEQLQVKDYQERVTRESPDMMKVLTRDEKGNFSLEKVALPHTAKEASVEFNLGEAFKPELERQAPQRQTAQRQHAAHRQPNAPQMGGPKL